ncbi:hypothetical protein [Glutamicibacter ardleyensis]|uniref:hypothetical protein n=1 Tax=Glutamicibacter ardleyensis TaxID=225894 RepID=UPI003FD60903
MGIDTQIISNENTESYTVGDTRLTLDSLRATTIKAAYTTRFVSAELNRNPQDFNIVASSTMAPRAGDVVIAKVTEIGKHMAL